MLMLFYEFEKLIQNIQTEFWNINKSSLENGTVYMCMQRARFSRFLMKLPQFDDATKTEQMREV